MLGYAVTLLLLQDVFDCQHVWRCADLALAHIRMGNVLTGVERHFCKVVLRA